MFLHNTQFILLSIAHHLQHNFLNGFNKVFKLHLIGIRLIPHNFDENQMIVILAQLFTGHSIQLRKLPKLRWSQHPFAPNTTLTMKQFQHVLDDVHFLEVLAVHVQNLLVWVVVISYLHIFLLLQASIHQVDRILHHDLFHVGVYRTHLLLRFWVVYHLVLNVERRIVVRLQQPWV